MGGVVVGYEMARQLGVPAIFFERVDGKLATDNAFLPICQGDDIALGASASDPITRVDFRTSAAVGAEMTLLTIVAGVAS